MSVWDDVVGQESVVATLQAARADTDHGMTHAWLFTGPPGSGRSNAARAFAAALECPHGGCGACHECRTALVGTHPDVMLVRTEGLSIGVEQARALVREASHRPSVGRWRVIVVEDCDRLTEPGADALLKSIEEAPAATVWLLCAPSLQDVIITIRSRCRHVALRTPPADTVAQLLIRRDGVDPATAHAAARAAGCHIGLARRLACDEHARARRRQVISLPLRLNSVPDAVLAAGSLVDTAVEEAKAATGERDAAEREELLHSLGADASARTQPPHVRAAVAELARSQKRRATRMQRDVIDRALVDLLSVYRDILMMQLRAGQDLVNLEVRTELEDLAQQMSPEQTLQRMEIVGQARDRLGANVAPLLAVEAMSVQLPVGAGRVAR